MSWWRNAPAYTLLYAVEVPASGGDTHFGSLVRLYDELDDDSREKWKGLMVRHRNPSPYFRDLPHNERAHLHPLLQRHPEINRQLVFASPGYAKEVKGCSPEESEDILQRLATSLETPDFVQKWQAGDLLVWDNRAVVHRATRYNETLTRHMWRISIRAKSQTA